MISEFLLVGPKKIGVMSELVIRKKAAHPLDALAFHELNPLMYLVVEVSRSRSPKYDRFILPSSGKFVHFLTVASQYFKRSHFYCTMRSPCRRWESPMAVFRCLNGMTCVRYANGERLTSEPATVFPMAPLYLLF